MTQLDRSGGNLARRLAVAIAERGLMDQRAFVADGRAYTYADLHRRARDASAVLARHGVEPGRSVLLVLPDGVPLLAAFLGAMRLGAIPVMANHEQHPDELAQAADISRPVAVVRHPGATFRASAPEIPLSAFDEPPGDTHPPVAPAHPDDPAYGLLTSGTTGAPKVCLHTHGDPYVMNDAFAQRILRLRKGDVSYSVSRMYFSYGLCNSFFYPHISGTPAVLTAGRPTPEEAIATIRDHGVTVFYAQPSFYARLFSTPGHEILDRLRIAVVGGEVLPTPLDDRIRTLLGDRLVQIIGTTEVGHAFACTPRGAVKRGWIGPVLPPYRIRIVDESGRSCPPLTEGRLEILGPTVAVGAPRIDAPSNHGTVAWWATGDAATLDHDGYLKVLGRVDDLEIVGGVNVHPAETEDLLTSHPLVLEAAVCAVRGATTPTRLRAYVVPLGGSSPESLTAELRETARRSLTWYKVPDEIVVVPALPRTATGKLDRKRLRELARAGVTDEVAFAGSVG